MNEFIEQFLIESRELIEQATADLLALEENGGDTERLDGAFRAFHTLKGAAGIVEFEDMGRALHVVEDALSRVRAGEARMSPDLVGRCLSALDQVLHWLDLMEQSGSVPADAGSAAEAVIAQFREQPAAAAAEPASRGWAFELAAGGTPEAKSAFRYAPPPNSFFEGEDPLALLAQAPGLLSLEIAPATSWPALEDFDPFKCILVITGTTTAAAEELKGALGSRIGLEIVPADSAGPLNAPARALLEAQLALAAGAQHGGFAGRLASAARTARAVLRHAGLLDDAEAVESAVAKAELTGDPQPLVSRLEAVLRGGSAATQSARATSAPISDARSVRVDVERIDALVRLTGEFQVAKNSAAHLVALAEGGSERALLAQGLKEQQVRLERLVAELQRSVVAIRVLPLRHVFQRFPRLVRELGQGAGKSIRLVIEGDETEADKTVVESLFEPLLHVLRNAVDHGVETPAQRRQQGKAETATLRLGARRRGDVVEVELEDDGRGIDVERVRTVAVARGVVDKATSESLSREDVIRLIFAPGFSTATTVSELSGRGVGMDAVRVAIERLGGQVTVQSREQHGTTMRLSLPFTVMMTSVVTVVAGGQPFGVPLDSVVETVRIPRNAIMPIGAAHAFVLRDRTIPVFNLAGALDGAKPAGQDKEDATVVVVSAGGQQTGLEVERLGERMDVILSPMEGLLSGSFAAAGTTMLGDGRVMIVLDIEELLR